MDIDTPPEEIQKQIYISRLEICTITVEDPGFSITIAVIEFFIH